MSWLALLPQIALDGVCLYVPGALLLFCSGVRRLSLFSFSPLFSFAAIGFFTLLSPWIPWNPVNLCAEFLVLFLVVLLLRTFFGKQALSPSIKGQGKDLLAELQRVSRQPVAFACLGMILNAIVAFFLIAHPAGSPSSIIQSYDNPFHYSVVRHILESGNASPIGAGSIMGAEDAIYPDLWHALVALDAQLFGSGIVESIWVMLFVLFIFVIPVGMCALASRLFENPNAMTFLFASGAALLVPMTAVHFLVFGSLFANLLGLAILPFALGLAIYAFRATSGTLGALSKAASLLLSCIALGLAHPNTVIVYAIVLLPFFVHIYRSIPVRIGLLVGFAFCWGILFSSSFFSRTVNCLDRIESSVEFGAPYLERVGIDYLALASRPFLILAIALGVVALFSAAAFLLHSKWSNSWYLVGIGLVGAQLFFSFFPEDSFSIIASGFWYRDAVRIDVMLRYLLLPVFAFIPGAILKATLSRIPKKASTAVSASFAVLCLVFCGFLFARSQDTYSDWIRDLTDGNPYAGKGSELNQQQKEFSETVRNIADGAVVLNNYEDGSVWLYPLFEVNALIKGRPANQMNSMSDDLYLVVTGIDKIGMEGLEAASVKDAAKRLNIRFVVQMSDKENATTRFNAKNQIEYAYSNAINCIDEQTPGFKLVAQQDSMRLFEITTLE